MAGKKQPLPSSKDFHDPFNAGQMVGMLVMLQFFETHKDHIPKEGLEKLKWVCAENAGLFLEKPAEDVFLLINSLVKEME